MNKKTTVGHTMALVTIVIWGTTFISTKILLTDFTPIEILFFRFLLGYESRSPYHNCNQSCDMPCGSFFIHDSRRPP